MLWLEILTVCNAIAVWLVLLHHSGLKLELLLIFLQIIQELSTENEELKNELQRANAGSRLSDASAR